MQLCPYFQEMLRIQTSSPHRVWPLHVQVCAPFTYGQFSKVSPIFICGRQMQRAAQLGSLLPRPAIILPRFASSP